MTTAQTIRVDIFIAGDIEQAKQVCREYCFEVGLCVTIEPVSYIYTGGEEVGVRVGLINYPRFPSDAETIAARARDLANCLMSRLCQHSYSIVGPETTEWFSRRPDAPSLSEGMTEALKPFAAFANALNEAVSDNIAIGIFADGGLRFGPSGGATVGDLRRALHALSEGPRS